MSAFHRNAERGFALFTSLLLLVIVTMLALAMFRSFAVQEHITGNLREKERALHAANSVQEYAEWWLLQAGNTAGGAIACPTGTVNANNANAGQICNTTMTAATVIAPPWSTQTQYLPSGMTLTAGSATNPAYAATPAFYIADLGKAGDSQGEAYLIDAYSYGGSTGTVAVVESVFEVQQGVVCRSCL
jgi:type IV pilus assembly protein PilX